MFIADMPIGAPKKSTEAAKPVVADEPPLMRRLEDEIGMTILRLVEVMGPGPSGEEYKKAELTAFHTLEEELIEYLGRIRGNAARARVKDLEPKHVGKCEHDFSGWPIAECKKCGRRR